MNRKILVLTSGKKSKLRSFLLSKRDLPINVVTASFDDISFDSASSNVFVKGSQPLSDFDIIYFRLVGKSLETASIVAEYAKKNRIQIIDKIYTKSQIYPTTLSKAQEMRLLAEGKISIPKTFFGSIEQIAKKAPKMFGYPFVIKSTSGSRGREVYSPNNAGELKKLSNELMLQEELGKKFFAQEYINCTKRIRVFVIGNKIIGAVSQLTKWRKRVDGYIPVNDEKKIEGYKPDAKMKALALKATYAVGIDIAGVDILVGEEKNRLFVIEVNAAPSWKLIKNHCRVNVEYEILKFVSK